MAKTGTKEWSEYSVNIQLGCEHDCRYCYAKYLAVHRFRRCTPEEWRSPRIKKGIQAKTYRKRNGVIMIPTSHDITELNLYKSLIVLRHLLSSGNQVLIVSKPHLFCVQYLCGMLNEYKNQIAYRFTIGSCRSHILAFWEPGAPNFIERFECLKYAYEAGFRTSVSCEPFLDNKTILLFKKVKPFITDSFWIGPMRDFRNRIDMSGVDDVQCKKFVQPLQNLIQSDYYQRLRTALKDESLIRWKDDEGFRQSGQTGESQERKKR